PRAIEQYQLALRSNPNFPEAHNNLAFALARTGQLSLAIQHYHQALHLRPHYALAAANLALAYSQTQQPDEAIVAAQEAISFAKATHQTQFAEQVQDWLNNYRAGLSQPDVPKP
ncbi:MAG TPA: tetratricopeptide repeat protein, partial [Tepidisphaeraceae bacterium]|nr:tetratricopeptide repeat protein [Tepidisphaeraceae bacterium]